MMNGDRLYTVQAAMVDGTKHNVVVRLDRYSEYFMGWWKLVKSGDFTFSYRVRWCEESDLILLSNTGFLRAVRSASSSLPIIQLDLLDAKYKDIEYPLEAFERFLCFRRGRPEGFGVCVTVKV